MMTSMMKRMTMKKNQAKIRKIKMTTTTMNITAKKMIMLKVRI